MVNQGRTTIGLKRTTKNKLDHNRAPGQCYDGFLCQMMELWEATARSNGTGNPRMANANQSLVGNNRFLSSRP